jgi:hypothetical protein
MNNPNLTEVSKPTQWRPRQRCVCGVRAIDHPRTSPQRPRRAPEEGKQFGRSRIDPDLERQILAALKAPGRTDGVRKIAERFGVNPSTVQRISGPFVARTGP